MTSLHIFFNVTPDGKYEDCFRKIEGPEWEIQRVEIPTLKYLETYAHRRAVAEHNADGSTFLVPSDTFWRITEASTGRCLGKGGNTVDEAVASVRKAKEGKKKADIMRLIEDVRAKYGTAPRPE